MLAKFAYKEDGVAMNQQRDINKRASERVDQNGYVKVVVESAPDASGLDGKSFECTARDLSASGLQIVADLNVPSGSTVRLYVAFVDPPSNFELIGVVVWSRLLSDAAEVSYAIGVKFVCTSGSGDSDWSDMIRSRMLGSTE